MEFAKQIDLSGLNCPLPILRTKKALADMAGGTLLQVIATDPGTPADLAAFCQQTGHVLRESTRSNDKFVFVIERKP